MNKAILIGRLTKDPEISTTNSGITLARFTVAIDRTYKNAEGEKEADFIPVVAWRERAEIVGKYVKKGNQIAIIGSIQVRSYDDKDGNRRYATEVVADNVELLGSKPSGGDNYENDAPAPSAPSPAKKSGAKKAPELTPIDDDDLPF